MEKINKNIVIASLLKQINKDKISIDEILEYSNEITKKLKGTQYCMESLDYQNICKFFKHFIVFGKVNNNVIELNRNSTFESKLDRFFLFCIDENVISLLKIDEKFVFPIIVKNELIKYYITFNNNMLDGIKDKFYYDKEKVDKYIFDLEIVKEKIGKENITSFLDNFICDVKFEKKEVLNCNTILEFIEYIDALSDLKFKNIENDFNISQDISNLKSASNNIINYYYAAQNNQVVLSEIDKLNEYQKKMI